MVLLIRTVNSVMNESVSLSWSVVCNNLKQFVCVDNPLSYYSVRNDEVTVQAVQGFEEGNDGRDG